MPQPGNASHVWSPPEDLSHIWPGPDDLATGNTLWHEELPEDNYDDWLLPGYTLPKNPLAEELWWKNACDV